MSGRIIHIEVPEELHKQLKLYAAMNDITLKDAVIKAIEEIVKKG